MRSNSGNMAGRQAIRCQHGAEKKFFHALGPLERLLLLDSTNEDAAQRFMLVLAFQRRRTEAMHFYQRFRAQLRQRHIPPSPIIQALFQAIRQGYDDSILRAIARGASDSYDEK